METVDLDGKVVHVPHTYMAWKPVMPFDQLGPHRTPPCDRGPKFRAYTWPSSIFGKPLLESFLEIVRVMSFRTQHMGEHLT